MVADGLGRQDPEEDASARDASAGDGADAAEQAFEALRAEVAGLGRQLDALARQGEQGGGAITPDYSPTLGAIAKELKAVTALLDGIERHPALKMTPASYRAEIEAVARSTAAVASRPFVDSLRDAQAAACQLEALTGRVRDRQEQQRWLATVAGLGVLGGVLLWLLLIRLLPWGAGDWLAALPIGGGRWGAGGHVDARRRSRELGAHGAALQGLPAGQHDGAGEVAMAVRTIQPGQPLPASREGTKESATPASRSKVAR